MNFAAIKFLKLTPEIKKAFPNVCSLDTRNQICVVPVSDIKRAKIGQGPFTPKTALAFDKSEQFRYTGLPERSKYPRCLIVYLGVTEQDVQKLINNGDRVRVAKVFAESSGDRTTDIEASEVSSSLKAKERSKSSMVQNMANLIKSHKNTFMKSRPSADVTNKKRCRSAILSPVSSPTTSPERKRSNSEERIERLKQMQNVSGGSVEELFEHMKHLEIERQLERDDMQRERERFYKRQEELISKQQAMFKQHQEEMDSWRQIQAQLANVLESLKNNAPSYNQDQTWHENSGLWSQPTPSRRVGFRTPLSRKHVGSTPLHSALQSEVEMVADLSQESGEFRMDLGALDTAGQRLYCHGPSYNSARRAKDVKEWCRHIMKGVYGESAKYYREGKPRKEGLRQIPKSHFQLIEGHYLSYVEKVQGVPKGSIMFANLQRAFPECLGNVGDVILRSEEKQEKSKQPERSRKDSWGDHSQGSADIHDSENATPNKGRKAFFRSQNDSLGGHSEGSADKLLDENRSPNEDRHSPPPLHHLRKDMGCHTFHPSQAHIEIPQTEIVSDYRPSDDDDYGDDESSTTDFDGQS